MPMYVILGKVTDQGAKDMKDLPRRIEENRAGGERLGVKLHGWYLTQGRYDFVVITEAPDDESIAAQVIAIAGRGNSRSETLRAFTLDEAKRIIEKIG